MSNTVTGYNRTQIILHWVIAALVVFQFVGHEAIVEVSALIAKGQDPAIPVLARAHVLLGGLTLLLMIWRIVLRVTHGAPASPEGVKPIQSLIAKAVHLILYLSLIVMPLSGMGAWFGGQEIAATVHTTLKFALILSIALHILGALVQQFVLKTNIMDRMKRPG